MSWARAFNGHLADYHQFLFAHMFGRIDSIDADIARHDQQIEARLARDHVEGDPGHQGPQSPKT